MYAKYMYAKYAQNIQTALVLLLAFAINIIGLKLCPREEFKISTT